MQTERQRKLDALAAIMSMHPPSLDNFPQHGRAARAALSSVQHNRAYAADAQTELSLVAAIRVLWAAIKGGATPEISNTEFLTRVAKVESSLVQAWRPQPAEPPPKEWTDPISGAALKNPFVEPVDVAAQELLLTLDRRLGEHFMRMAKDPYRYVAELRAAEAKRQAYAKIDYNGAIHKTSPFVSGDDQAISNFIQTHDSATIDVFQQERQPARCFWSPKFLDTGPNRQTLSDAVEADPEVGLLLMTATKVEAELAGAMGGV